MIYPYGEDAMGYLIYTTEDYVSVHIMRANRPRCASDDYRISDHRLVLTCGHPVEMNGKPGRSELVWKRV